MFEQFIRNFGEWKIAESCKIKDLPFISDIEKFMKATNDSKSCTWTHAIESEWNIWDTDCGASFSLEMDKPSENKMVYCCFCGNKLKERFV